MSFIIESFIKVSKHLVLKGADEILRHPFFEDIDLEAMSKNRLSLLFTVIRRKERLTIFRSENFLQQLKELLQDQF